VGEYVHNAMGQRVVKDTAGGAVHFVYDLSGRLVAEADGTTGAATAEYVYEGMPLAFLRGGAVYYIHTDHLGTPQALTDSSGAIAWNAVYRPFGETAHAGGSVAFNLRFPGQYFDAETGLHYNWFRDYDPALGRYVQSDPIGLRGGWNTYGYVGGNPVRRMDWLGLDFFDDEFGNSALDSLRGPGPAHAMSGSIEAHLIIGVGIVNLHCCDEENKIQKFVFRKGCIGATVGISFMAGGVTGLDGVNCRADRYSGWAVEFSGGIGPVSLGGDVGLSNNMVDGHPARNGVYEAAAGLGIGFPLGWSWCYYQLLSSETGGCCTR